MVIEYQNQYKEDVKDLLEELQAHLANIDIEGYNILTKEYKELYFEKVLKEVNENHGKILLYKQDDKIVGLVVGIVNNEEMERYDFKAPKRGRITELVVSGKVRSNGIGTILLKEMEKHLKSIGCESILLVALAYNENAIRFYKRNGYHMRATDMIKTD